MLSQIIMYACIPMHTNAPVVATYISTPCLRQGQFAAELWASLELSLRTLFSLHLNGYQNGSVMYNLLGICVLTLAPRIRQYQQSERLPLATS